MAYYGPFTDDGEHRSRDVTFGPGVGFDDGLVIAAHVATPASSIVYE